MLVLVLIWLDVVIVVSAGSSAGGTSGSSAGGKTGSSAGGKTGSSADVEGRSSSGTSVTSVVPSTASRLLVGPAESEDVIGMLVTGVEEVERVERLFAGVVLDYICWFSKVKLTVIGSEEEEMINTKLQDYSYICIFDICKCLVITSRLPCYVFCICMLT